MATEPLPWKQCASVYIDCLVNAGFILVLVSQFLSVLFRFIDLSLVYDLLPQFLSQIFAGTMVFIFRMHGDRVRSFEHSWSTERGRYSFTLSNLRA